LDKLSLAKAAETAGVDEESLNQAAVLLMQDEPCFIAGQGLTPFPAENKNMAALWNLSLLCKGKLIALGLENNQRGVLELQRSIPQKTKPLSQLVQDKQQAQIKALYAIGPVPLGKKIKPEFLVVQDSYRNEVSERADVVLPATTFAETEGTFINVEGRIQRFSRVIPPVGESKPDWWILSQLAKKLGNKGFGYKKIQDVLKEMKKAIPAFTKKNLANVKKEETKEPKFVPVKSGDSEAKEGKKFPFVLCWDYNLDTYRNLVLSREIKGFGMVRNAQWIKINPLDAKKQKIEEGESVVVESAGGKWTGEANITKEVPEGVVKASFLWSEGAAESCSPLPVKIKRGK
jgi:hypothetical protein